MKRMFAILLLLMIGLVANCYATDGDIYNDGYWRVNSSGASIPLSGASQQFLYEKATTGDTLVVADSGKTIVFRPTPLNTAGFFALPTASVGMQYTIVNGSIGVVTVKPVASDTIAYVTLDAGDKIVSPAATGDSVTLVCYEANKWAVRDMFGTYTDGGA